MPEVVWPLNSKFSFSSACKRIRHISPFRRRARSVIESNLQQNQLNSNHDERLDEQRRVEFRARVVEHSAYPRQHRSLFARPNAASYLKTDATSMINGISKEKPALDLVRCMEYVWSAYEVMGEIIMKMGAAKPVTKDTMPILTGRPDTRRRCRRWLI